MQSQMGFQKKAIISRLFDFDQRMINFLFESTALPNLRDRPGILLNDSWELTPEQQILVRAALDIFSGSGHVFLWELLNRLSEQNLSRLILALIEYHKLEQPINLVTNQWWLKNE